MFKKLGRKGILIGLLLTISTVAVMAQYIPNSRDTKESPEKILYTIDNPTDMEQVFDNDNFTFYFRDELDVLAIYDKTADHTYKTGLDIPFDDPVEEACDDLLDTEGYTVDDLENTCLPIVDLSSSAKKYVNSFLAIEYLEDIDEKSTVEYSADIGNKSSFSKVENDGSHWVLDVDFKDIDVEVRVHFYFTDTGFEVEIRDDEIEAELPGNIVKINVAPFMGAVGGTVTSFDTALEKYSIETPAVYNPGYSFVPDGSGALIRFEDTNIDVDDYSALVYGDDLATQFHSYEETLNYIETKTATLPVFGMSYGDDTEMAFVAYASSGDEYMEIHSTPLTSKLGYIQTYASFNYNNIYLQRLSNEPYDPEVEGGFTRLSEDRKHYDVYMHYEFLNGDGSSNTEEASYVGMALTYRNFLLDEGLLTNMTTSNTDIPLRVDFLMADSKTGIFGYEQQISTTVTDVENILTVLHDEGVKNINSSLLGWQSGGMILTSPDDTHFANNIGSKRSFESLFNSMKEFDYDVTFYNDYGFINQDMESLRGTALKHQNGQYYTRYLTDAQTVEEEVFVNPDTSVEWLLDHNEYFTDMGATSITVSGITNNLSSAPREDLSREDSVQVYLDAFSQLSGTVNAVEPNIYFMKYVDRYFDVPVYSSQYIIASDTVPFIQLVLQGTVEMYASYSNFSFSSANDILRMIDYNVYPSFILTQEPSYVLASTNSNKYISTQFSDYEDLIVELYGSVNGALSSTLNAEWENRTVLEAGLILNEYSNGVKILINYSDQDLIYNTQVVEANDYLVIE